MEQIVVGSWSRLKEGGAGLKGKSPEMKAWDLAFAFWFLN
jgi:hypothetical protein